MRFIKIRGNRKAEYKSIQYPIIIHRKDISIVEEYKTFEYSSKITLKSGKVFYAVQTTDEIEPYLMKRLKNENV